MVRQAVSVNRALRRLANAERFGQYGKGFAEGVDRFMVQVGASAPRINAGGFFPVNRSLLLAVSRADG